MCSLWSHTTSGDLWRFPSCVHQCPRLPMSVFAINDGNLIFLADQKMYSVGLSRMHEDARFHSRSVPKLITTSIIEESTRSREGQGHVCVSIDLVCKVGKITLEKSSVFVRRSTFRVSFHGFIQKRPKNRQKSYDPTKAKCCKLIHQRWETQRSKTCDRVSCRFFNKRDLWKTMH